MNTNASAAIADLDLSTWEHIATALKAFLDGGDRAVQDQITQCQRLIERLEISQADEHQTSTHECKSTSF